MIIADLREVAQRVGKCDTWGNDKGEDHSPNTLAALAIALADKLDQAPPVEDAKYLMKALLVMRTDIGMLEFLVEEGGDAQALKDMIRDVATKANDLLSDRKAVQMRYEGLRDLGFVVDVDKYLSQKHAIRLREHYECTHGTSHQISPHQTSETIATFSQSASQMGRSRGCIRPTHSWKSHRCLGQPLVQRIR